MEAIKKFFAKDSVKVIAGAVFVILDVLLFTVMPDSSLKQTLMLIWNSGVLPLAVFFGVTSGGTSGLRNDTSNAVTAQLVAKGQLDVVPQPKATIVAPVIVNPTKP